MAQTRHKEYRFGEFLFIPARHLLLHRDKPVPLGSRALNLLELLVRRSGKLVAKQELRHHVWPNVHLHESNLKVTMSALRRALARDHGNVPHIVTIAGRGYRFVAPVQVTEASPRRRPRPVSPPATNRADAIAALSASLLAKGWVTVAGPAGIGKATVAVAIAVELETCLRAGSGGIDPALLDDARIAAIAIGTALGLPGDTPDALSGIADLLRGKVMLLVLDNREPFLDVTAGDAEAPDVAPLVGEGHLLQIDWLTVVTGVIP